MYLSYFHIYLFSYSSFHVRADITFIVIILTSCHILPFGVMSNDLPTKINVDVDALQVPVRRLDQSILVTYRLGHVTRNAYAVNNVETANTVNPLLSPPPPPSPLYFLSSRIRGLRGQPCLNQIRSNGTES